MTPEGIASTLSVQRWLEYQKPFRHLRATNVFEKQIYESMESNFNRCLKEMEANENSHSSDPGRYDAWMLGVTSSSAGLFHPLFSREWHDLISDFVGVATTGHIDGGLHHHRVGSANGWIHNDLCVGWFQAPCGDNDVVLSDHIACNYSTGACHDPQIQPLCLVRSVALIFYLANFDWAPGYGGETGLYETPFDGIENPAATLEPINNSLVIFECTPHSYHSFLRNSRMERNCIVLWAHSTIETASTKFGEASIRKWVQI